MSSKSQFWFQQKELGEFEVSVLISPKGTGWVRSLSYDPHKKNWVSSQSKFWSQKQKNWVSSKSQLWSQQEELGEFEVPVLISTTGTLWVWILSFDFNKRNWVSSKSQLWSPQKELGEFEVLVMIPTKRTGWVRSPSYDPHKKNWVSSKS